MFLIFFANNHSMKGVLKIYGVFRYNMNKCSVWNAEEKFVYITMYAKIRNVDFFNEENRIPVRFPRKPVLCKVFPFWIFFRSCRPLKRKAPERSRYPRNSSFLRFIVRFFVRFVVYIFICVFSCVLPFLFSLILFIWNALPLAFRYSFFSKNIFKICISIPESTRSIMTRVHPIFFIHTVFEKN